MQKYDVIILGGGASGCMCSLNAPKNKKVLIIDNQNFAGKKILATGNGRCNITNAIIFPSKKFYNQNIDNFLFKFDNNKLINFLYDCGLITYNDEEGRIYPISNSAKSVVDIINNMLNKKNNVKILTDSIVKNINYNQNQYFIKTDNGVYISDKLVIATGGNSLENIEHNLQLEINKPIASLVAIKTENTKILNGIRISPAKITATINNKTFSQTGEILFKDSGISGISGFNISSLFARNGNFNGEIYLDLLPQIEEKELTEKLLTRRKLDITVNKFFDGIFLPQVAYFILNKVKIDENRTSLALKYDEIVLLAKTIKKLKLKVKDHYENNQIYSGGIKLSSLTENLESKKYKGLYFCGEVCDVDGLCGGYNLQWAWTSGYIVGKHL